MRADKNKNISLLHLTTDGGMLQSIIRGSYSKPCVLPTCLVTIGQKFVMSNTRTALVGVPFFRLVHFGFAGFRVGLIKVMVKHITRLELTITGILLGLQKAS